MNQQNQQSEKPKERRFDPELLKKGLKCDLDQYEMLKHCNEKKDTTEWNNWIIKHPDEEIWLEGAYLFNAYLEGADFSYANLKKICLFKAHLKGCNFGLSHLEKAQLGYANLKEANLEDSRLQGTIFSRSYIEGANFETSIVDGETSFWKCLVNRKTNFAGVGIDTCRIDPATKQLLEYNIRRKNWESWYKYKNWQRNKDERNIVIQKLMWFIKLFWSFSDYGRSTWRIISWFFGLALFFAVAYSIFAFLSPPGIVSNLSIIEGTQQTVPGRLLPLRAIYFSVVTMTTLGFGDMYANAQSIWGHILLTIQVILGYVLLGALVTRFAVLFTAGGPAGKFADEKTM